MSAKIESELLELLDITWVCAPREKVVQLLPQIKQQNKYLIRDNNQFRIVERGMISFYQPTEIVA